MDTIESLLSDFHAGATDRFSILEQLSESRDERVVACLLNALVDTKEDEFMRVEVLKLLPYRQDSTVDRDRFGRAVMQVLGNNADDVLVRQYAAKAMRLFIESDGALELLEDVVRNASDDIDVRHNGLDAIEANASLQHCQDSLSRLVSVPELGKSAQRTLLRFRDV